MTVKLDETAKKVLKSLETTWDHVFLTGNAGTGKSTLLDHFRNTTQKNVAVVAPTGVAAVNVKGETIHSFFKFPPNVTPEHASLSAKRSRNASLYKNLQTLIVDEISMVRADLLDSMDVFLKQTRRSTQPFGGVQLIMVGDLYQLPPVVSNQEEEAIRSIYGSPYFFSSKVIQQIMSGLFSELKFFELDKIYRQNDMKFVDILNRIRNKTVTDSDLDILNRNIISEGEVVDHHIILTTVNSQADMINQKKLDEISGPTASYRATMTGEFTQKQSPASEVVMLKTGARVMMLNNDPDDRWINGTLGTVYRITSSNVTVKLDDGEVVDVEPVSWTMYRSHFNQEKNTIENLEVGSFKQMPIRLAWAVTIHKSQGKTFDKVVVDIGWGSFAHGQTYVALSRCTTLSGLKLIRPLTKDHIIMDTRISSFLKSLKQSVE